MNRYYVRKFLNRRGHVITPSPLGVAPAPREEWPSRESISGWKGWRVRP